MSLVRQRLASVVRAQACRVAPKAARSFAVAQPSLAQPFTPELAQGKTGVVQVPVGNTPTVSTLRNGVRLVTVDSDNGNVDLTLYVNLGPSIEVNEIDRSDAGIIKRFFLKETKNVDFNSVYRLVKTELGADAEVTAGRNSFSVTISTLKEDYPRALAYLAEFYANAAPNLSELKDIEHELENAVDVASKPVSQLADELVHQAAFGSTATSRQLSLDTSALLATNFKLDRTVVAAIGVKHDEIARLAEQIEAPTGVARPAAGKSEFNNGDVRVHRSELSEAIAALAFKAPGIGEKEFLAAELLAHATGATLKAYNSVSLFNVAAAGPAQEVYPSLVEKATKAKAALTADQFAKVKESFVESYVKQAEDRAAHLNLLASTVSATGQAVSIVQKVAAIKALSLEDVSAVSKKIFGAQPAFAAHGNILSFPRYDQIVAALKL